ncbi:porin [Marinomonas sp. TW1]|uniref:porin n=1 Tax=Marinomonas sp. TW1 TaxID=1561203 RepID=UPI0007AF9297|nr:porin [Marinomonas sp. TW1]KZN14056.1 porin [Marinomonas sp. TW1]
MNRVTQHSNVNFASLRIALKPLGICLTCALVTGGAMAGELYSSDTSSLSFSGVFNLGVQSRQLSSQDDANVSVDSNMMNTSHIGLSGQSKLSAGLVAKMGISSFIQIDKGESTRGLTDESFYSRYAWGGLEGSLGSIKAGRLTSLSFINTIRFNPFGASSTYSPSFLHTFVGSPAQPMATGLGGTDSAWDNAVQYSLPNMSGMSISLMAAPDEGGTTGERYGASVTVGGFPFAAVISVDEIKGATFTYPLGFSSLPEATPPFTAKDYSNTQLGLSYDVKTYKFYGQVSQSKVEGTRASVSQDFQINMLQVGLSSPVGPGVVKASLANSTMERSWAKDLERTTMTLGYDYALSKQATWFTRIMKDEVTDQSSGTSYGTGVSYAF